MIRRMKVMHCWKDLSINCLNVVENIRNYIKDIDIPDTFNLHLDITKVKRTEANYQWSEEDEKKIWKGCWLLQNMVEAGASISQFGRCSQTVLELNDTNDAGIGLKSVIHAL